MTHEKIEDNLLSCVGAEDSINRVSPNLADLSPRIFKDLGWTMGMLTLNRLSSLQVFTVAPTRSIILRQKLILNRRGPYDIDS